MNKKFAVITALFITVCAFAQQTPKVPVDPAVRIGKLDNGLTYYIRHNEEPKGQANFYIAQKVGSILEEENQRGLAHFLEHMCFNGTQKFPGNGIITYCESIGVKFGADLNAYTSIDETVYNIDNVPVATTPSSIDSCLWILHDWADGLLLDGAEIDKERGVIHEEWRNRSEAQLRMFQKILPEIYPGNRYGCRLPIGVMEVVDNFPHQALRDYYEKWYRPDQQGIVIVGDIDVDQVEGKIKDIFGTIATPVNPAERKYFKIEGNKEPIISIAKDKEQPYAMSYIYCKHDGFPEESKDELGYLIYTYALNAISTMIDGRIEELTQSANPPFIQAQIEDGMFMLAKTQKAFTGVVISAETQVESAISTLYREMLRAARGGFTASEYERAKAEILSQVESQYKQREKRKSASFCREYVRHFIDKEPIPGIENEYALLQQIIPAVPVEVINQTVAKLIADDNIVVFCMLPDKEGVTYPSEKQIADNLAAVAAEDIKPYEEKVSNEPLISKLPVPGKIVKVKDSKFGYKKYTLSNGANVYLKKTDFNADEIRMKATSKGGTSLYGVGEDLVSAKCAEDIATLGGVGNFSTTELTKLLAGKKVSVAPKISQMSEGIVSKTTPKDFETMLQLNYLYFTSIREDAEAFASWKTRIVAALKNVEANPMYAFSDSLKSTVYANAAVIKSVKAEEVEGLDYAKTLKIARERFANAADFNFIITGNIDEETALPLIEQYIGSLPSNGKKEQANAKLLDFAKGKIDNCFERQMEVPIVVNAFVDNSSKTGIDLKSQLCFEIATSALTTVLLEEIREKEGGTYGIDADGQIFTSPTKRAYMTISYKTDPDRYEYLNGRIREIVADFAKKGPREEDLSKAKEYMAKTFKENQRENHYFASIISEYIESGVDMNSDYEKILSSITVKDVQKVIAGLLKQGNHSEIIMKGVK